MNHFVFLLVSAFAVTSSIVACSSSTTGNGATDGGLGAVASGESTLACSIALSGLDPQCQFYEATGSDAARTIEQLRAGCVDQAGATAHVVSTCPTSETLGGCKTPVKVQGAADVKLFVTNFEYKPGNDASILEHKTAAEVESSCKSQGTDALYVASP